MDNEEEGSMLANEFLAYFGEVSADFIKGMSLQTYMDESIADWGEEDIKELKEVTPGDKKSYIVFSAGVKDSKYSLKKVSSYNVVVRLEPKFDPEFTEDFTIDNYQKDFI